jgi:hypothetical protein
VQARSPLDNPDAAFLLNPAGICVHVGCIAAAGLASHHPLVDAHQRGALTVATWPPPQRKKNPTRPTFVFVLLGLPVGRVPNSALQGARGGQPEQSNDAHVLTPPQAAHL